MPVHLIIRLPPQQCSSANGGYNAVASQGTRSQVQFHSYTDPGQVVFTFDVSGSENAPYGTAFGRFDFLARPYVDGSGSFFDVFTDPAAINETGPGTYTFTYTGPIADPLDVMFYSASGVLIGLQDPASGGLPPDGASFMAFADYSNTVNLSLIELFTATGDPITEWSLEDVETGEVIFDQDGRVSAVPAPGSLGLLATGVAGLAGTLRRRKKARA